VQLLLAKPRWRGDIAAPGALAEPEELEAA